MQLDTTTRCRHLHVVGSTGTGKSTLLLHMLQQDLAAGRGICLIDPLGGLATAALGLIPPHRAHQVRIIDPADLERPIGFNVLDNTTVDMHATVADDIVAAFMHIFGKEAVGDRSQQVLRNSVRALLYTPGSTLLCVPKLLTNDEYRQTILRRVLDPVVLTYWQQYAAYDERWRVEVTTPIQNKLDAILSAPGLRNIVAQPRSTIDLRATMDQSRILIINLQKSWLGENNARVLGALLLTKIAQAAFSRADTPEESRRDFFLYCDEFQDFATSSFIRLLSQSRAYRLNLALSQQFLGQLDDQVRQAVFGNVGSFLSFRVGAEDAPLIASHLGLKADVQTSGLGFQTTEPEQLLTTLPNYQAYLRTLIDDMPTDALHIQMPPPPRAINHRPHRLITNSRIRFGKDRATVEANIARFLAN